MGKLPEASIQVLAPAHRSFGYVGYWFRFYPFVSDSFGASSDVRKNQSDYLRRHVWISENIGWSFQKCSSDGEQCNSIIDEGVLSKFRTGISCDLVGIATRRAFHRAWRSAAPGSVRSKQRTFSSRPHSKYDYREDVRAAELNPSPEFLFLVFLLPWVRSFQRENAATSFRTHCLLRPMVRLGHPASQQICVVEF